MGIRGAGVQDLTGISNLLQQLRYPGTEGFLKYKMVEIMLHPNAALLVFDIEQKAVAFMAIDFIMQLGLEGDFARVSYFAVDKDYRGSGIGKEMEEYAEALAVKRKCDRIELHCHECRFDAHGFYQRQGYRESPKYFIKMISKTE